MYVVSVVESELRSAVQRVCARRRTYVIAATAVPGTTGHDTLGC